MAQTSFFSNWIHNLLGKPLPKSDASNTTPVQSAPSPQTNIQNPVVTQTPSTTKVATAQAADSSQDPVQQDMKKFSLLLKQIRQMAKDILLPLFSKAKTVETEGAAAVISGTQKTMYSNRVLIEKIARIFIAGLFLLLILYVGYNLIVKFIPRGGTTLPEQTPTPTLGEYIPTNPSVYADDPEMKALTETINVLDRELFRTNIRVTDVKLPELDFNVSF